MGGETKAGNVWPGFGTFCWQHGRIYRRERQILQEDPAGFPSDEPGRGNPGLSLLAETAQNGTTSWGSTSGQHLHDGGFI